MNKPILYIFGGANGSGKTTVAKNLTTNLSIPFVNADEIAYSFEGDFESNLVKASRLYLKEVKERLSLKKTFAIESTLSGKVLQNTIEKAKENGFHITIIYSFLNDPKSNIERIKIRVKKGGHHVDDEAVRRRFYRSKARFWKLYKNLSDNWILMYNSSERLQIVASGNKKETLVQDKILFESFLEQTNEKA